MSFSSGVFSLVAGNPVVTGTTISSTTNNNTMSDVATGLSTCLLKDGTQTATAAIPFVTGVTTTSGTFNVFNTVATTINAFGGASSALNMGNASGTNTILGTSTISKVTITPPTTSATLTLIDGSSLITAGAFAITLTSTGTTNVTLPTSGTLSTYVGITLGTSTASTSGTSIDFTGIPSTAKRVIVNVVGMSTNGTSDYLFQLGDSGGPETTGYLGTGTLLSNGATSTAYTAGFGVINGSGATNVLHGTIVFSLEKSSANTWAAFGTFSNSDVARTYVVAGSKSTSATLDRVRITTVNGSDTFDLGEINISYE